MNEEVRSQGQMIMGVIYLAISVPIGLLSLGFLFSYPDSIWYLGIVLATSSGLMIYSGVSQLRKVKTNQLSDSSKIVQLHKMVSAQQQVMTNSQNNFERNVHENAIRDLSMQPVHWTFPMEAWKNFVRVEGIHRRRETIMLIGISTLVFAYLLKGEMVEGWTASLIIGLVSSVLIFGLRHQLKQVAFNVGKAKVVELIIDNEKVYINGKLFYFRNSERQLVRVDVITKQGLQMLEFTYSWVTRKGRTEDSLMVPIPEDKRDEAEMIVQYFKVRSPGCGVTIS